jgi:3-hydroxyisobutyrate dehydrogenase-like beta-hydroxyacid dehydrogenase
MADVAVLGIGRMGAAMTRRLAVAGYSVVIWNRTPAAADRLVAGLARGARVRAASVPTEAVADAELVLVTLASGAVTEVVVLDSAVLAAARQGVIICDMGTSGVSTARVMETELRKAGLRFVDAPVSGSVPTVEAGQLLVMASGESDDIAAIEPVLRSFAKQVVHVGGAGTGQAMKLAVNLIVHDLNAAVSEALVMATRAGISAEAAYDVFQASVVGAPFVHYKRGAFLGQGGPVAMSLELSAKDLGLITSFAHQLGLPALATRAVQAEVRAACTAGFGGRDMADLACHLATERTTI